MSLDRLLAEVEGRPLPKRPSLKELGIPFREPVGVEETMATLDDLGMWEDLDALMKGHSHNADVIDAGREPFIEAIFAALGIYEVGPMRQIHTPREA